MKSNSEPTFRQKIHTYIYNLLRTFAIKIFEILPIQKNKIIFDNFAGKGYADNPKYIADELLNRKQDLDLVWLINDMNQVLPKGIRKVKYNSIKSLYEYATAKVIVDNIRNSHLMRKKEGQVYLQTWHGSKALKNIEKDAEDKLSSRYIKEAQYDGAITDGIIADSGIQEKVFVRAFYLNSNAEILRFGLPRNDILIKNKKNEQLYKHIRNKLTIPQNNFVVLYAPTFRDNDSLDAYIDNYDELIKKVETIFGRNCTFLVRMHPNVNLGEVNFSSNENVINVSSYPDVQELALASDCLITDYSSIMFDFLILEKTVFLYSPDLNTYISERGLSNEYYKLPFQRANTIEELKECIENHNENEYLSLTKKYLEQCSDYNDGRAAARVADWILKKMEKI